MSASMKDVARLANVSTATVSHVINNTRNVTDETRKKVNRAIKYLNYNVNPVARNLRSGSSKMIGYVVSNLTNYFYMDIAVYIDAVLSREGYHLTYINSNEDPEKERDNIESLMMQNVDGLIIAPVGHDCSYMADAIGDRCPCVFFDRIPYGFKKDCIMSTNYEGAFQATELLIERGHRAIGVIASRTDDTMNERLDGYKAALRKHKIPVLDELIKSGSGQPQRLRELKSGDMYELTRQMVQEEKVTAIFSGNILSGIAAVNFLKQEHYRIPEDIALITFDDSFWLSMMEPAVTAMDQDLQAIGTNAAKLLLGRIHKEEGPYRELRIPTKLIERGSC
ncbi:MAG: LacI family DNA-binding transcriptional regulator [Bacteroidetes bacterium]|nr:LacI family DNA-binding transcriptional regulator [Bacteroidota bacterium]